jgi:hypothetical protein
MVVFSIICGSEVPVEGPDRRKLHWRVGGEKRKLRWLTDDGNRMIVIVNIQTGEAEYRGHAVHIKFKVSPEQYRQDVDKAWPELQRVDKVKAEELNSFIRTAAAVESKYPFGYGW